VLSLSRPFLSRANPASSWTVTKTRRAGRCECRSWPADSYPVFGSEHIDDLPRNCIAQPRLEPGYARAVASPSVFLETENVEHVEHTAGCMKKVTRAARTSKE
jgi:hypothetical protein